MQNNKSPNITLKNKKTTAQNTIDPSQQNNGDPYCNCKTFVNATKHPLDWCRRFARTPKEQKQCKNNVTTLGGCRGFAITPKGQKIKNSHVSLPNVDPFHIFQVYSKQNVKPILQIDIETGLWLNYGWTII